MKKEEPKYLVIDESGENSDYMLDAMRYLSKGLESNMLGRYSIVSTKAVIHSCDEDQDSMIELYERGQNAT